jgi:hypothetical protein
VSRRIAWALFGLTIALIPVSIALGVVVHGRSLDLPVTRESMLVIVAVADGAALLYGTVGLLIARREPRNAIGWIFLGSAVTLAAMAVAYCYADLALYGGEDWAGGAWAGWFANWSFIPPVFIAPCFIAQLFPNGRPLPGRWRWVLWASVGFATQAVIVTALEPGRMDPYPDRSNPAGIDGAAGDLVSGLNTFGEAIGAPSILLVSLAALVVRFRRSRGVERSQMKWLTFAGAVLVAAFALSFVWEPLVGPGLASDAIFLLGIAALVFLPVAVAIAILRHRLYEIDRVISRTLVYGLLTVVLGAAYFGLVLAGQAVFSSFAGGSDLAIAVSTLVVAALFLPLRSRVQRFVDRRFYRRRYDAQRTLEAFGARLREQVDLAGLRTDLESAVRDTMQPAHISVWLRREAAA